MSLALIRLAYTSVPEGKREASTFRLERSHPVAAIADMEDIPVLTASIRCPLKIEKCEMGTYLLVSYFIFGQPDDQLQIVPCARFTQPIYQYTT